MYVLVFFVSLVKKLCLFPDALSAADSLGLSFLNFEKMLFFSGMGARLEGSGLDLTLDLPPVRPSVFKYLWADPAVCSVGRGSEAVDPNAPETELPMEGERVLTGDFGASFFFPFFVSGEAGASVTIGDIGGEMTGDWGGWEPSSSGACPSAGAAGFFFFLGFFFFFFLVVVVVSSSSETSSTVALVLPGWAPSN